ncbi:hypothetical protein N2152v2_001601 [Parachlorella kessleri]
MVLPTLQYYKRPALGGALVFAAGQALGSEQNQGALRTSGLAVLAAAAMTVLPALRAGLLSLFHGGNRGSTQRQQQRGQRAGPQHAPQQRDAATSTTVLGGGGAAAFSGSPSSRHGTTSVLRTAAGRRQQQEQQAQHPQHPQQALRQGLRAVAVAGSEGSQQAGLRRQTAEAGVGREPPSATERAERMALVTSLLRWLRLLESSPSEGIGRGPLTTLLMAELDSLVDEMSYEELYDVFGGHRDNQGLSQSQIRSLPLVSVPHPSPVHPSGSSSSSGVDAPPAHGTRSKQKQHQLQMQGGRVVAASGSSLSVFMGAVPTGGEAQAGSLLGSCCAVCLEEYRPADVARCLPACGHAFHAACIDPWLHSKAVCPICRAAVEASAC